MDREMAERRKTREGETDGETNLISYGREQYSDNLEMGVYAIADEKE